MKSIFVPVVMFGQGNRVLRGQEQSLALAVLESGAGRCLQTGLLEDNDLISI